MPCVIRAIQPILVKIGRTILQNAKGYRGEHTGNSSMTIDGLSEMNSRIHPRYRARGTTPTSAYSGPTRSLIPV